MNRPIATQTANRTIWIARHGNRQDFVNPDWRRTATRPDDPGLSDDGLCQAQELAQHLQHEPIDHIFASPFLRTVQTAAPVATALNLPLKLESGLGEYLSPKLFTATPQKLSLPQLKAQFPQIDAHYQSLVTPDFPESWSQLLERVGHTTQQLVTTYSGNLLLVGHAGVVVAATLGLAPQTDRYIVPICGLTQLIERDRTWVVTRKGDNRHLTTRSNRFLALVRFWSRKLWRSH